MRLNRILKADFYPPDEVRDALNMTNCRHGKQNTAITYMLQDSNKRKKYEFCPFFLLNNRLAVKATIEKKHETTLGGKSLFLELDAAR